MDGERDSPIMSPIAKGIAEEDLRKIAAYFAAKTWPAQNASPHVGPGARRSRASLSASRVISRIFRVGCRRRLARLNADRE
jgi:hypothetical protein